MVKVAEMNIVESLVITTITNGTEQRWCSRVRFEDGTELYAGVDNQAGKETAEKDHDKRYSTGIRIGKANPLPYTFNPGKRARIDYWQPLPEGWV